MINIKKRVLRELILWELLALDLGKATTGRNLFEVYHDQLELLRTITDVDFEDGTVYHNFADLLADFDDEVPEDEIQSFKLKTRSDLKFNKDLRNQIDRKYQRTQDSDEQKMLELEMSRLDQKISDAQEILNQLKKKNEEESLEIVQNSETQDGEDQNQTQDDVSTLAHLAFDLTEPKKAKELKALWDNVSFWDQVQSHFETIISFKTAIDIVIQTRSLHWRIERMSTIDRNVLRLAVYELYFQTEIPVKVTINEAIEIAKKYGSVDSSRFINGILDKIAMDLNRKPARSEFKKQDGQGARQGAKR